MPDLATIMALSTCGYNVIEGEPIPTIACAHEVTGFLSAPDWDSLLFYAQNYALCECPWH
jgi:hypothetical protein